MEEKLNQETTMEETIVEETVTEETIMESAPEIKPKRKITDSVGWAYAETIFYLFVSTLLCGIIFEIFLILFYVVSGQVSFSDLMLGITPDMTPVGSTAFSYFLSGCGWIMAWPILYAIKSRRPIAKAMGKSIPGNNVKLFFVGILIGGGLNALCAFAALLHKDIEITFDSFQLPGLLLVFACVFVQSSFEELMCRGVLYQLLMRRYNKGVIAIVGNSLLFGVLHLMNSGITVLSIINIVVVGIFFSLMVYYLDSIWCAMAAHTAWNFTQNIIFGLPNSGTMVDFSIFKLNVDTAKDSICYNVGFGIEGTLLCDVVLIIGCILLYLYGKKKALKATNIWA